MVGAERKVEQRPVKLAYVEEGFAVVEGVRPGARVVVEGAQNLRPGTVVAEARRATAQRRRARKARAKGRGPRQRRAQ